MHVVVVGSLNMDLVVHLPQIPRPGETLLGGVFTTFPGGKGANQAVAAARLGADVTMIGCVGGDSFGQELRDTLIDEGIDTSHILVSGETATGVALIQVDASGQNSIAVASGANFQLTSDIVEKAMQSIGKFDVLIMPLETPLDTIYTAAKNASLCGAKVLLNPAPAQVLEQDLLELVDVLIPNEYEIALVTGIPNLQKSAEKLLSLGVKNIMVTMGSQGVMLFDGIREMKIPAWSVQAVDTTAAGDCFVGAMAVELCKGKSLTSAAEFACAAAAISVTHYGAQPSLPRVEEVLQFLNERKKSI